MGVGGQHHAPAALPPGNTQYPLYSGANKSLADQEGNKVQRQKIEFHISYL